MEEKSFFIAFSSPEKHVFIFENKQVHLTIILLWDVGHHICMRIHNDWNQKIHHDQRYNELRKHEENNKPVKEGWSVALEVFKLEEVVEAAE